MKVVSDTPMEEWGEANMNALQRLVAHYLLQTHRSTLSREFILEFVIHFVAITGSLNYYPPAARYGSAPEDLVFFYVPEQNGAIVAATAAMVLYNAFKIFLDMTQAENFPEDLAGILNLSKSEARRVMENVFIGVASFLSAIPLTSTFWTYVDFALWAKIAAGVVIQADNTVLHFLPIKLMLNFPVYRFPFLPIEYTAKFIADCSRSQSERNKLARVAAVSGAAQTAMQAVRNRLMYNGLQLTHGALSFNSKKLSYDITLPGVVEKLRTHWNQVDGAVSESGLGSGKPAGRIEIDNILKDLLQHDLPQPKPSTCMDSVRGGLIQLGTLLGGLLVFSSCTGYLANPTTLMYSLLPDLSVVIPTVMFPTYAFAVLLVFFGVNMGRDTAAYLTSWGENDYKVPYEIKLRPKTYMLSLLANIYICIFSYAAAAEMVENNYQDGNVLSFTGHDDLFTAMIWAAILGLNFLVFHTANDFTKGQLKLWLRHSGSEQERALIEFDLGMQRLVAATQYMTPGAVDSLLEMANQGGFSDEDGLGRTDDQGELADSLNTIPINTDTNSSSAEVLCKAFGGKHAALGFQTQLGTAESATAPATVLTRVSACVSGMWSSGSDDRNSESDPLLSRDWVGDDVTPVSDDGAGSRPFCCC